jgi:hypothetical protein
MSFSDNMTTIVSPQVQQKHEQTFYKFPSNYQKCHVSNDMRMDDDDSSSDESVGSD